MKKIILLLVLVLAFFTSFSQLDSTKFNRVGLSYRWPYGWATDFYKGYYGNSVIAKGDTAAMLKPYSDRITAARISANGLDVFGNSIGQGTGATTPDKAFAYRYYNRVFGYFNNYSKPGDQAADLSYLKIVPNISRNGDGYDPLTIIEIGTNDARLYQFNANKFNIFKRSLLASLSWAAIPRANKTYGQNFILSGFTAIDSLGRGLDIKSVTNGNTATGTITTLANSYIYLWYLIRDNNLGKFTVTIDGASRTDSLSGSTTILNYGDGGAAIATGNSGVNAVACSRFLVTGAGSHTVVITNTGTTGQNCTIYGIGTMPASSTLNPYVLSTNVLQTLGVSDAYTGQYSQYVKSIDSLLVLDRMNVIYNDIRSALGTTAGNFADSLHPSDAGHALIDSVLAGNTPSQFLNGARVTNPYNQLTSIPIRQPLNPTRFATPYAGNLNIGSTTTFNAGTLWGNANGNLFYTNYQAQTGITNAFPNAGGAFGWSVGKYDNATSGLSPTTPPPIQNMYIGVTTNGSTVFYPNSSAVSNTMLLQNNTVNFGPFKYIGNAWSSSFTNNYFANATDATSGTNQSSSTAWLRANIWNGSNSVGDDIGWRNIPLNGTNATTSLRVVRGSQVASGWNVDLSLATLRNKLGFINLTNTTSGTAGTDSILVKNTSGDVGAISPNYYLPNPITTTGDIIYSSSGSTAARLPIGTNNQVLTVSGGVPTWQTPATVISGTYTPTLTNIFNITSSSLVEATYTRIANIVQVFLKITVTPTSILSNTQLNFSLPFNSVASSGIGNVSVTQVGLGYVIPGSAYWISSNTGQAYFQNPSNTTDCTLFISYTYQTP